LYAVAVVVVTAAYVTLMSAEATFAVKTAEATTNLVQCVATDRLCPLGSILNLDLALIAVGIAVGRNWSLDNMGVDM
jgi:hypothetical protein